MKKITKMGIDSLREEFSTLTTQMMRMIFAGDAHDCKQEKCAGGGCVFEHPRGELSDKVSANPQGKSCDRHGQPPYLCGIHLGRNTKITALMNPAVKKI